MDRETELTLVRRLRESDAGAFEAIHDHFNARLFSFLARLTRRRDVAEDLLEETWLRLVANPAKLRPDTRLAPWLFTVARNLYVSYRRSRLLEESHAAGLLGLWPAGTPHASPFEFTAANETQRRLEHAIGELPLTYREALLLVAVEGLRPADAAAVCAVAPEALRQRVSRARAMLAARLGDGRAAPLAALKEVTAS